MLRWMSFNIRYGRAKDGVNAWGHRKKLVLAQIHAFAPDLLGVQECRADSQADFLKTNLPDYHFVGWERGGEGETALEMAPLLFKVATFELLDRGVFWLSETPNQPGSKSWGAAFPRTVTWVHLRLRSQPARTLYFFNIHFDYLVSPATMASARLLQVQISHLAGRKPVLVSGDFNAEKDSPAYRLLTAPHPAHGPHLRDAYRDLHPAGPHEGSFHAYGQQQPPTSIDWLLVSHHWRTLAAEILTARRGKRYPSDHYPLTAVVE